MDKYVCIIPVVGCWDLIIQHILANGSRDLISYSG
jgi:hypothetical protein